VVSLNLAHPVYELVAPTWLPAYVGF